MWIKICANTNLEDAALAVRLGADAVGFVFAPSKRKVTAEQVAAITPYLPAGTERIGVFTDSTPDEIARVVEVARLDAVQLHGVLDEGRVERIRTLLPQVTIIPVVHWEVGNSAVALSEVSRDLCRIAKFGGFGRVLIDAKVGALSGGTGVALDWGAAREIFEQQREKGLMPILAGGLRPENVAEAIRTASPWGVDVASGVEASPGRKDPARLASFLEQARGGLKP